MKKTYAALFTGVAALSLLTGCGDDGDKNGGNTIEMVVFGTSNRLVNKHEGLERCEFSDGEIATGDRMTIEGPTGEILGVAKLVPAKNFSEHLSEPDFSQYTMLPCTWEASFHNVDTSKSAYTVTIDGYGSVVVSSEELQCDPLLIETRGSLDVLFGQDEKLVAGPPKNKETCSKD